jgi:hypothetical protein
MLTGMSIDANGAVLQIRRVRRVIVPRSVRWGPHCVASVAVPAVPYDRYRYTGVPEFFGVGVVVIGVKGLSADLGWASGACRRAAAGGTEDV